MKFIEVGMLLVAQSASSLVEAATGVFELEPEQWAMVVLGLFLVGIQAARTKKAAEPLGLDN